jgi:ammonia channel protein AmtB
MIILLLGFAAACTAGILYPLDWIIGIRLAKEDELTGLDRAGIIRSFRH